MNGQRVDTAKSPWYRARFAPVAAVFGALSALIPSIAMWGFTVDDALISIRYAHHLGHGSGYAFNAHGPATDGVTPLPWTFFLVPLAYGADLTVALVRAKVLGVLCWTVAAATLGAKLGRRAWPLALVAAAFPIGAWAASGMETGLAIALATLAAVRFERPTSAAALAGLAASLRPELVPWALAIAAGATIAAARPEARIGARLLPSLVAIGPFALCTFVRLVAFGAPVPLAVAAKPSDAGHGLVYAVAALVVGLMPLVVLAPVALRRAPARAKTLVVALLVHALVMVAVGGDWMPYARLVVPILPGLALAASDVAAVASRAVTFARVAIAGMLAVYTITGAAAAGRHVQSDRAALIERARPALASSRIIAALDIGWVGAATDATIVDLAGLTDPSIAALPGGHTSKSVDVGMLLDRQVDSVLVYSPPRLVEQRLITAPLFAERFEAAETLPLGKAAYVLYRARSVRSGSSVSPPEGAHP